VSGCYHSYREENHPAQRFENKSALTIVIAGMLLAIGPVLPDKPTLGSRDKADKHEQIEVLRLQQLLCISANFGAGYQITATAQGMNKPSAKTVSSSINKIFMHFRYCERFLKG